MEKKTAIIIGKLIPAGTGMKDYKGLSPQFIGNYKDSSASVSGEISASSAPSQEAEAKESVPV